MMKRKYAVLALILLLCCFEAKAEDGSRLWLRTEKNAQQEQPKVKMSGKKDVPHRRFSKDEKLKIVKAHLEEHASLKALKKEYGIGTSTIARWVQEYLEQGQIFHIVGRN